MDSVENFTSSWVSATTTAGFTMLVLMIFFFFWEYRLKRKKTSNQEVVLQLPPGPAAWPIIGNLHMLGELPHRSLKDLADTYGPIMSLRFGSVTAVVVSSPEMAKHFLKTKDLIFSSRPASAAGKYLFYNFKDVAFAPYGDYWREMRKICVLELLTERRIKSFQSVRIEEVSAMIRSIWQESENGAKSVNVSKALSSLTANIICRTLMGKRCSMDASDKLASVNGIPELIRGLAEVAGVFDFGDFIPCVRWLDLQGIRRRMKKLNREFDKIAEAIIDERVEMRKLKESTNGQRANDFVDVLLDISGSAHIMGRTEMKALVFDMISAGTDTAAVTLEWAMSELLRNHAVMKRVQGELESTVGKDDQVKPCDLRSLEYLNCVVKETMRLRTTGPLLIPHESMEACTVAGYHIPAKTRLIVNAWAIGTDPAVWGDDALAFKPERFMPGGRHRHIDVRGQNFELTPFGSGRRGCPGMELALEVVGLALAQLLQCFDWSLECRNGVQEELDMSEAYGMTMPRRFPLYAVPSQRLHAGL